MSNQSAHKSCPFTRWFFYLLIGVLLSLSQPNFSGADDRAYSATVQTFEEFGGILRPTPNKIWLDGPTYSKLHAGSWLRVALAIVAIDALVFLIYRTTQKLRKRLPSVPGEATLSSPASSRL